MNLTQRIRRRFLNFLKRYFNPLIRRIANSGSGPFALVQHVGRRSGRLYETPIIVQPVDDGFVFELTYGPEVDWYRNIVAAGRFTLRWHGKDYVINRLEPMDAAVGLAHFPLPARLLLRALKRQHFLKMIVENAPANIHPSA